MKSLFPGFLTWLVGIIIGLSIIANGYEWRIGGVHLNPERVVAVPLFAVAILLVLHRKKCEFPILTPVLLVAWSCWSLLGSLNSEVSVWSVRMWLLQSNAILFYFLVVLFEAKPKRLILSRTFRLVTWFMGLVVVGVYLLHSLQIDLPSFALNWFSATGGGIRIRATIYEPNIYGTVLLLFLYAMHALKRDLGFSWYPTYIGLFLGLILSFSRAPWFAYPVGLCVYIFLVYPKRYEPRQFFEWSVMVSIFLVLVAGVGYLIYIQYGHYDVVGRVGSIKTRLVMWKYAYDDILRHPLIGSGMSSLSKLHPDASSIVGSTSYRSIWISNLFLAILHDSGIVGFILFMSFTGKVMIRGMKAVRSSVLCKGRDVQLLRIGAALIAFGVTLLVTGQSIPTHTLGFYWVLFGLVERVSIEIDQNMSKVEGVV